MTSLRLNFVAIAAAFLVLGGLARAEIIGTEQFDYPDGPIAGQSGGIYWDYENIAPAGHNASTSNWESPVGSPTVTNGRLVTSGNSVAKREYGGNTENTGAVNELNDAKKVFYRVSVTTGPTVGAGDSFGLSSLDFNAERLFFGKRIGSSTFGVEQVGVGGTNGSVAIQPNTTYTLVAVVNFADDLIRLYVNPNLNSPEPAGGSAAASRTYTGTNWSTAVRLSSSGAVTWDNLVVTTDWDDLGTVVNTTEDQDDGALGSTVSLREAVKHSISGTLITFDPSLSGQTITLDPAKGEMEIEKTFVIEGESFPGGYVTIDADDLPAGITVNANRASRIFQVHFANRLTLTGMTLTRGMADSVFSAERSGGAIEALSGSTLFLMRCTFSGNVAKLYGGAISFRSVGVFSVRNCTFTGNSATGSGGAILSDAGQALMTNCTFAGNSADSGGAIYNDDQATLTNCTLAGNAATSRGGAIFNSSVLTLHNTLVSGNTAPEGPDVWRGGSTISATGVNFIGNLADSGLTAGPALLVGDARLSPLGSYGGLVQTMHPLIGSPVIDAASSSNPGGTDVRGFPRFVEGDNSGTARLDIGAVECGPLRTVITEADGVSGSLRNQISLSTEPGARIGFLSLDFPAKTITLGGTDLAIPASANGLFIDASNLSGPVTISGNNASRVFDIAAGATVVIHSLRIANGRSDTSSGGGIYNSGTCSVISSTFSANSVTSVGGGINNNGTLILRSCTLSGNSAISGGGIYNNGTCSVISSTFSANSATAVGGGIDNNSTCTVVSSTLSANIASSGGGISNFSSAPLHVTTSIVAGNTGGNISGTLVTDNNNLTSGDPLLGPLANHGGPTQTMRLLSGSPARDIGGSANEVQEIPAPPNTDVSHSLTFKGQSTPQLPYGMSAAVMQAALTALSTIGPGNVTVTESSGGLARTITFTGDLGNADQPKIISSFSINNNIHVLTEGRTGNPERTDQRGFARFGVPDIGACEAQLQTINGVTMKANTTSSPQPFTVGQVGTLNATSGNTTLIPNSGIALGGGGANRTITFTPAADQYGSALITITDSLSGETSTFTLTVSALQVTVTGDSGPGSLRQALAEAAANPGPDSIYFSPSLGTIRLSSEIVITDTDGVTLNASTRPAGVFIDGGTGTNRHFRIDTGAVATFHRLRLFGGNGSGGGTPAGYGGSIHNGGSLTVRECTFDGNTSGIAGAIYNQAGSLTVERSTFHNNSAGGVGAILHESLTPMFISHSTFTNNDGGFEGGALTVSNFRPATITHCTISGNRVTSAGGGGGGGIRTIAGAGNLLTLSYSIVTGNTDANSPGVANAAPGPGSTSNMLSGNALLAPLADYGGPTQTMALRPGSPALNVATASAATADQRGFANVGAKDLGAYEAGNALLTNYNAYIWETLPNTAPVAEAEAGFDFDRDGSTNEIEWLAQTGPGDPASAFRPAVSVVGGNRVISFPTATGRTYRLEFNQLLDANTWIPFVGSEIAGDGSFKFYSFTTSVGSRRFFRVLITP